MNIFYSRKAIAAILTIVISVASLRAESLTAVFNWANPAALTPAFEVPGPGSLGVYLDGKTITANGVKFFVDDSEVKELSRKARFYYGYLTNAVELRIYSNSDISSPPPRVWWSTPCRSPDLRPTAISSHPTARATGTEPPGFHPRPEMRYASTARAAVNCQPPLFCAKPTPRSVQSKPTRQLPNSGTT